MFFNEFFKTFQTEFTNVCLSDMRWLWPTWCYVPCWLSVILYLTCINNNNNNNNSINNNANNNSNTDNNHNDGNNNNNNNNDIDIDNDNDNDDDNKLSSVHKCTCSPNNSLFWYRVLLHQYTAAVHRQVCPFHLHKVLALEEILLFLHLSATAKKHKFP